MTDKRESSIHVRLSDRADEALEMLCAVNGLDKARVASDLLHRALLGEVYAFKVAASRYMRSGLIGRDGDL